MNEPKDSMPALMFTPGSVWGEAVWAADDEVPADQIAQTPVDSEPTGDLTKEKTP